MTEKTKIISQIAALSSNYEGAQGEKYTYEDAVKKFRTLSFQEAQTQVSSWTRKLEDVALLPPIPKMTSPKYHISRDAVLELLKKYDTPLLSAKQLIQVPILVEGVEIGPFVKQRAETLSQAFQKNDVVHELKIAKDGEGKTITRDFKGVQEPLYNVWLDFPYPSDVRGETRIPSYIPPLGGVAGDREFLVRMQDRLSSGKYGSKETTQEAVKLFTELVETATLWDYSTNTIQGLLNRIQEMGEARSQARKARESHPLPQKERILELVKNIERFFPKDKRYQLPRLDTPDIGFILNKKIAFEDQLLTFTINVNPESNAGVLYTKVKYRGEIVSFKKGQTLLPDIKRASEMIAMLSDREHRKDPVQIFADFYAKFRYVNLFLLFLKMDPYLRSERYKKGRGIAALDSASTVPAQILLTPMQDYMVSAYEGPAYYDPETDTIKGKSMALYGTSVYNGGVDWYVNNAINLLKDDVMIGTCILLVYADNVYLLLKISLVEVVLVSLDGKKAESTISEDHIKAAMRVASKGFENVTTGWKRYAEVVYPQMAVEGTALLWNQQIIYPAMGSGVVGTAIFNGVQMLENLCMAANLKGGPSETKFFDHHKNELGWGLLQANSFCGAKLTIERVFKFSLANSKGLIPLDLLGFDAIYVPDSPQTGLYLPVLNWERMKRALVLNKNYYDEEGNSATSTIVLQYLKLIKIRALLFMGAWTNSILFQTLMLDAIKLHRNITNIIPHEDVGVDKLQMLAEAFDLEEHWLQPILAEAAKSIAPTLYEIFKLATGDAERADKMVKMREGIIPYTWLYPEDAKMDESTKVAWDSEMTLKPQKRLKPYSGFQGLVEGIVLREKLSPATMALRKLIPTEKEGLKEYPFEPIRLASKVPTEHITKDVGTPGFKLLPKEGAHKYTTPTSSEVLQKYSKWLNTIQPTGVGKIRLYRVPVNERFIGRTAEIKNELFVGATTAFGNLINERVNPKDIAAMMDKFKRVHFIINPVLAEDIDSGVYDYTEVETLNVALVPSAIFSRRPDPKKRKLVDKLDGVPVLSLKLKQDYSQFLQTALHKVGSHPREEGEETVYRVVEESEKKKSSLKGVETTKQKQPTVAAQIKTTLPKKGDVVSGSKTIVKKGFSKFDEFARKKQILRELGFKVLNFEDVRRIQAELLEAVPELGIILTTEPFGPEQSEQIRRLIRDKGGGQ